MSAKPCFISRKIIRGNVFRLPHSNVHAAFVHLGFFVVAEAEPPTGKAPDGDGGGRTTFSGARRGGEEACEIWQQRKSQAEYNFEHTRSVPPIGLRWPLIAAVGPPVAR